MDIFIKNKKYTGAVKAVVLDWAGTVLDYGSVGPMKVFVKAFAKHGVAVELDEVRPFMGLKKIDHVRGMLELATVAAKWREAHGSGPDQSSIDAVYADTEPMMVEAVKDHADLIPGLLPAIESLRSQGIKIGSCTGYTGPIMEALKPIAARNGYEPDCLVCSTDVPGGRPYPWMALQNAINLEVHPLEAMVKVGDTVSDIQEGLNAGMWTVGLSQTGNELGLTREQVEALFDDELAARLAPVADKFWLAGAHYVVPGIWDLPGVIHRINQRLSLGETPAPGK
jgi:phosphonoacetaldehyde hydrolase